MGSPRFSETMVTCKLRGCRNRGSYTAYSVIVSASEITDGTPVVDFIIVQRLAQSYHQQSAVTQNYGLFSEL